MVRIVASNMYSSLKKVVFLCTMMLLTWGNVWAETMLNTEYKSGTTTIRDDVKTHEHTEGSLLKRTVYDDLIISGTGTVVIISGDLTMNGKLTVSKGATLIVEGDLFQNEDVSLDGGKLIVKGDWKSDASTNSIKVTDDENSLFAVLGSYNNGGYGILIDPKILVVYNGEETGWPISIPKQTDSKYVYVPESISSYTDESAGAYEKAEQTLTDFSSLLPISLNYFVATQKGDEVVFEWQTASEINNDFFTVEYSIDGVRFYELFREDGNGTTSVTNDYHATISVGEFAAVTYFRLKQTDFAGEYSYSNVIFIPIEQEVNDLYVFPNSTTDYVTVSGNVGSAYVSDRYGKKMSCMQISENTFDVAGLSVGTYYVVVNTKNGKIVLPFVKK